MKDIKVDLTTFSIDDLPIIDYVSELASRLDWRTEPVNQKFREIHFEFVPQYDPELRKEMKLKYNIEQFVPQIQVFDKGIVIRKDTIRAYGLVWRIDGKWGRSNILVLLCAMDGSLRNVLERAGCTVPADFPELLNRLDEVKGPEYILHGLSHLKKIIKTIEFDYEPLFWLTMLGTGGRKVQVAIDRSLRILLNWLLDIHEEKGKSFIDDILNAWEYAYDVKETNLWKKRLRLVEHCLYGIKERLIDLFMKTSGKQVVSLNLAEYWYKSGLFVYSTASNLLGLQSLKLRTTLKGLGGFKDLPFELRLLSDELVQLGLCPIDTGDRENAGAVHFYTDTVLIEKVYPGPTLAEVVNELFNYEIEKSFCSNQILQLIKKIKNAQNS